MRTLAASVLFFEALVICFAASVAMRLSHTSTATVWEVAGSGAVLAVLLAGLLRHRWAYLVGTLLQIALIASGAVVTTMYFLGAVFAVLWAAALYYGNKVDVIKRTRARAG